MGNSSFLIYAWVENWSMPSTNCASDGVLSAHYFFQVEIYHINHFFWEKGGGGGREGERERFLTKSSVLRI